MRYLLGEDWERTSKLGRKVHSKKKIVGSQSLNCRGDETNRKFKLERRKELPGDVCAWLSSWH